MFPRLGHEVNFRDVSANHLGFSGSGLASLLGGVGALAGNVKLRDDGVADDPVDGQCGGHGVGEAALSL